MFEVVQERQFTARLKSATPVDGGTREETFKATYRVLSTERIDEIDLATKEGTDEFLRAVIVELHELVDANRQALPYNDEIRDQVMIIPYARRALIDGYFSNVNKARKGN